MSKTASLTSRIEAQYSAFSSAAQNIANYLQLHPLAIVSMSVTELAHVTSTSKATVSRFFRQLGYSSHLEAKQQLLAKRESGFPIAQDNSAQGREAREAEQEIDNIRHTLNALPDKTVGAISTQLAEAKRIVVIGYRNSYPLALTFSQQLKQIRSGVYCIPIPGQTIAEEIVDFSDQDLIVLIGFRRRPRIFEHLITALKGKQTVLMTDPSGQIYNKHVTHLLVCQLGSMQAFDSYAAPMSVITLLCNRVYNQLAEQGQLRTSQISELYDSFNELS